VCLKSRRRATPCGFAAWMPNCVPFEKVPASGSLQRGRSETKSRSESEFEKSVSCKGSTKNRRDLSMPRLKRRSNDVEGRTGRNKPSDEVWIEVKYQTNTVIVVLPERAKGPPRSRIGSRTQDESSASRGKQPRPSAKAPKSRRSQNVPKPLDSEEVGSQAAIL